MILPMIIVMTLSFPTTYAEHNLNLHPNTHLNLHLNTHLNLHPNLIPTPISTFIPCRFLGIFIRKIFVAGKSASRTPSTIRKISR